MAPAIVEATIVACILTATANILAQCITIIRSNSSFTIQWIPVFHFVLYTFITCPANFAWQQYIESCFPSQTYQPSKSAIAAAAVDDDKELDEEQAKREIIEEKFSIRNVIIKLVIDQTLSAAINTIAFIVVIASFKGADLPQAIQIAQQDAWPLMKAGWRLWPLVSFVNYAFVRTVSMRSFIGSMAGLVWGIYLSLVAA